MRKLTILFALLTLSVGLAQAECVFTYTAIEKLESQFSGLGTVTSHNFNNGEGTVTFSSDVTTIKNSAFQGCTALQSVDLSNVTTIGDNAFAQCPALQSITLPASVTTIGRAAFDGCTALQSITLPASVTTIGKATFRNCESLTEVTVAWTTAEQIPAINANVFEWIAYRKGPSDATLHVPAGTQALYEAADVWNTFGTIDDPAVTLSDYQAAAIAEINAAIEGVTDESILAIANKAKTDLNAATSKEAVTSIKNKALADIADAILAKAKTDAIAELKQDMGDYAESEAIYNLIGGPAIEEATNVNKVTEAKDAAKAKLEEYSQILGDAATAGYNKGVEEAKTELLGTMAEPCGGCTAVEVKKGDKVVTLYAPESVRYIRE